MRKQLVLLVLLAIAMVGTCAHAQTILDNKIYLPQKIQYQLLSVEGKIVLQSQGDEIVGTQLSNGMYYILSEYGSIRMCVSDEKIIGMNTSSFTWSDIDTDPNSTPPFGGHTFSVNHSPENMIRDSRRLKGDYYVSLFIFYGDTIYDPSSGNNHVPWQGSDERPDLNTRLFIGKNFTSRAYSSSATTFPATDTLSTIVWFKYVFDPVTGSHTFIPRDTADASAVLVDRTYDRTDSIIVTADGVTREAIILTESSSETKMILCRYMPTDIVSCTPTVAQPKPQTIAEFKALVASYGPMDTWLDTIKNVRQAVYYVQGAVPSLETHGYMEANIYTIPFEYILHLYSGDWGGVCGNYAAFLRRALVEVYGMRAWEFSIGENNTQSLTGHMQTLVEHIIENDSLLYVIDGDFNCHYIDSLENPMDLHTQIQMAALHRQQDIGVSENTALGTYFQEGPCLQIFNDEMYTDADWVEAPSGSNSMYRQHMVRRIESLAIQQVYVDISMYYTDLEARGYIYRGDPKDFPMSVIWFRGLFNGPQPEVVEQKIISWLQAAGLR